MPPVKPYRSIPIRECGEALVHIPRDAFAFYKPHAYVAPGARYRGCKLTILVRMTDYKLTL